MLRTRMFLLSAIACAVALDARASAPSAKATRAPAAPAANKPADTAPDFPPPKPDGPQGPRLMIGVPNGWKQAGPPDGAPSYMIGALLHSSDGKTMDGMIALSLIDSTGSLADNAAGLKKEVTDGGGKVVAGVSTDELITFAWSGMKKFAGQQGKSAVYRAKKFPKKTLMLIGFWPTAGDADRSADFDAITSSIKIE